MVRGNAASITTPWVSRMSLARMLPCAFCAVLTVPPAHADTRETWRVFTLTISDRQN